MAVWVSSDWHCQPGELKDEVVEWIRLGKEKNIRLIGAGDLFDILPLGEDAWKVNDSIEQLIRLLDGYPFDYVTGNHDPFKTMKKLMANHSNIVLHKELRFELDGRWYYIAHGHKWALDWGYLGLRRIAPWFVEKMVDVAPGIWYSFCRWQGWLADERDPNEPDSKELERINKLTRIIWAGASDHALKKGECVILGHTHTTGRRERGINKDVVTQAYMADDGNLPDGSYVEITDDARIQFLR